MRVTLDDLRQFFNDQHGDVMSAFGVAGLATLLMFIARLAENQVLALVAFVNLFFLWVPLGGMWQRRRLRERWKLAGLDAELLRHCARVAQVDASLDEHVDTVLGVYTTIYDLSRHQAWLQYPGAMDEHLACVREGLVAFFQRVERVDELRKVYDRCAESLRRPGRLAAQQQRVDREYKLLETLADAFERALLDFSDALAAAMGSGGEEAASEQLSEFSASMRRLAQSIDEAESPEALFDGELDEGAEFDRLLAEEDALAFDDEPPVAKPVPRDG